APTGPAVLRDRVNDVEQRARVLRGYLDSLLRPFAADLPALIDKARRADALPALWPDIEAAFAVPFLDGKLRGDLWSPSRLLARRLHEKTRNLDRDESSRARQTDQPSDADSARATAQEARRAAWRAEVAVDLFRLGGLNGLDKLEAEVADAVGDPQKVKNWP